jgi:formylglycine-generating enzyme required for sulfatase activity
MITDNRSGVMGRHDSPRASNQGGTHGATELRNFSVHDNTIRMPVGATGIVGDSAETFSSAGNRFRANDYVVNDTSGRFWEWNRDWGREAVGRTWSEWNAFGNDRDGSLN